MSVHLSYGDFSLALSPEHGGSVSAFKLGTRHLLRPALSRIAEDWSAADFAAFPMVPFSGRIANGKFEIDNTAIALPPNMPPEPHAIHGFGWQSPWQVQAITDTSATLVHEVAGGHIWPWPYQATQTFSLNEAGLTLEMSVINQGNSPMPAGLGWHPYFPRKDAIIAAPTERIWTSGEDMIPGPPLPVPEDIDLTLPQEVEALTLDYAFDVTAPIQTLTWPDVTLRQISDPLFSKLIVYVPPRKPFFCVEPASHSPDAVNSGLPDEVTGLKWLDPGEQLRGTITLLVEFPA